ncbi:unnamed protein product [Allacma fusca]|uniref:Uncharacterized protein n=1 Tax=Allacma fusca TaxID=39272 RepID=A0A8J2LF92_9HEXA|nr:unnamed protein product [Allacma fusca]
MDKFLARLSPRKCNTRVCKECLLYFSTEKPFRAHISNQCTLNAVNNINIANGNLPNDFQRTRCIIDEPTENIPPIGAKLEFSRFDLTLMFPFVIYGTFQGGVEKTRKGKPTNEEDSDSGGLRAYPFVIVRRDSMGLGGNKITKNTHVVAVEHYLAEEGVTGHFFQRMFFWAQQLLTVILNTNLFRQPTMDELAEFERISHCQLFQSAFTNKSKLNSQYSYKIPWDYENWQDELTTISDEEQQIILECEDKNIYQTCSTKPILRTLHHNHFGEGGRIEAVIFYNTWSQLWSSDIKVLAKSPNEILQIEIASDNMYIPKLVVGMDNGPGGQFTGQSRKAKIRITNSMNFVNEQIFESFSASLGLGESSSANILEKCLKSFFPCVIIPTDKLQAVTQLICKLPLLENILEQDLLLPDAEESTRNPRGLISLKRKSERQESRQDKLNHIGDKQFRSFNLLCQMFEINGLAGLTQFYNCIESSVLACFWKTYRQSAYNSFKLD